MRARIWFCPRDRNVYGVVRRLAVALVFLCLPLLAVQRWNIQYSYHKLDSLIQLRDFTCPSTQRCIAAGVIAGKNGHEQGVVVLTSDGGKNWSQVEVKDHPLSLFFLNDSLGWMVTDRGIWSTSESGRSWTKLEGAKGARRVHFLDASHGYAIGFPKVVYETTDGGKKWSLLAAAEKPRTEARETVYDCIYFSGEHGAILGNLIPNEQGTPIWLDQDQARYRREHQTKVAVLETLDGGKQWKASTIQIVGTIAQLRFAKDGSSILVVEYTNYFSLPSSVYKTDLGLQGAETIFEEKDRAVTDVAVLPDGSAILASIEPPGSSNQVPIPGKLKMFESSNLKTWLEMGVDYRAVAQRAMLAAVDARHVWVATDTGMILNLVDTENRAR